MNAEMTLMMMMVALDVVIIGVMVIATMSLLAHVDMMDVVATAALSLAAV